MSRPDRPPLAPEFLPIGVVIEHRIVEHRGWRVPKWEALGAIVGEAVSRADRSGRILRSVDGREQVLWEGLELRLHRDGTESYRRNLVGKNPSLFFICHEREGGLAPLRVTADYDEAAAHMEVDGTVLSAPMPAEVYRWLEQFVLEHHRPETPSKRKRQDWVSDEEHPRGRRR